MVISLCACSERFSVLLSACRCAYAISDTHQLTWLEAKAAKRGASSIYRALHNRRLFVSRGPVSVLMGDHGQGVEASGFVHVSLRQGHHAFPIRLRWIRS